MIIEYFNRFIRAFPTIGDTQDEVIRCLTWLYDTDGAPIGLYTDTLSLGRFKHSYVIEASSTFLHRSRLRRRLA
jgi:hypothetical protein